MLVKFVILACVFVACLGASTSTAKPQPGATPPTKAPAPSPPAPQQAGVFCGTTPVKIFECLDNPHVVNKDIAKKCSRMSLSECDKVKCVFRESGWSTKSAVADDKVNKQKVAEYFDQFAIDNPVWSPAVQHLKITCLDKDLPPQGTTQNCAAYDVMHCIQTSFLKNTSASQWRNTAECVYPRAYAASCPFCPSSCFSAQVPIGTCNACLALARTP